MSNIVIDKPSQADLIKLDFTMTRKACLLGNRTGTTTGIEVLCELLGYNDLGEFHLKECRRIEAINPFIAHRAVERATFKQDDLHEARLKLSKSFNPEQFEYSSLKKIWLWGRGMFKTTILSYVHTIQLILIDPNIRILIMHHKLEKAKDILAVIKQHFMINDRFRNYFPEYCPVSNSKTGEITWDTSERVTVLNRTHVLQEPTIDVGGVDTIKTGAHYDYIKKDDLVTEKSVTSETMLQQSIDADAMTKSLFDIPEKGPEDYIGTRYHFADMYSHKLRSIPEKFQSIIPCWDKDGTLAFPERFSKDGLDNIRKDQGSYIFSTQYLLNCIDPASQIFKKLWIQWYDKLPEILNCYLIVDPATTKKKRSDYTAMIVIGIDEHNNWYICDIIRDKLDVKERIDEAWTLATKWNIVKCLWESVGFQETDVYLIKDRRQYEKFKFSIDEVKTAGISKTDRVRALQPNYERGQVFWPREMRRYNKYAGKVINYIDSLLMEYETFPMCEHDDLLDAHSMILKTILQKPREKIRVQSIPENSYAALIQRFKANQGGGKLIVES